MKNFQATLTACFVGYIVQAIINNFAPLLFLTFQSQYQLPITQITLLVSINFLTQLLVDFCGDFLCRPHRVSSIDRGGAWLCCCWFDWFGRFSSHISLPFQWIVSSSGSICNWRGAFRSVGEPNR